MLDYNYIYFYLSLCISLFLSLPFFSCSWRHSWQYHIWSESFKTESGVCSHIRWYHSRHLLHSTIYLNFTAYISLNWMKLKVTENWKNLDILSDIKSVSPCIALKNYEMLWSSITIEYCRRSSKHWNLYNFIISSRI